MQEVPSGYPFIPPGYNSSLRYGCQSVCHGTLILDALGILVTVDKVSRIFHFGLQDAYGIGLVAEAAHQQLKIGYFP